MSTTRNTPVFLKLLEALTVSKPKKEVALSMLEQHFQNDLIVIVGNIETVMEAAKELRLDISKEECAQVLDYLAHQAMVSITIEHVEKAAYAQFGNRFIEP